jgi:hypothetical protein
MSYLRWKFQCGISQYGYKARSTSGVYWEQPTLAKESIYKINTYDIRLRAAAVFAIQCPNKVEF